MSRSGYSDELDNWALIKWRGRAASATRGARGQRLIRELGEALDAMPNRRLVAGTFAEGGEFCALGVVAAARGIDPATLDPENPASPAQALDIAEPLAQEIMFENDEGFDEWRFDTHALPEREEARWRYMRAWVRRNLK